MTTTKAVAFCFTSSHTVSLFGKDWVDSKGSPYKLHVYPGKKELALKKGSPNVVLVTRFESRYNLAKVAKGIHRVILFCTPEEAFSVDVPVIDAKLDEEGKPIGAIRTRVQTLQEMVEGSTASIKLKRAKKAKKKTKKKKKSALPKNLTDFLDAIEEQVEEGDIWEDLEQPLISFVLVDLDKGDFMTSCQWLAKKGVKQKLSRGYYRWITASDDSGLLLGAFEGIDERLPEYEQFIEEDGTPLVKEAAEAAGVVASDLNILLSLSHQYREEDEDAE
jgi:hypothetical protein